MARFRWVECQLQPLRQSARSQKLLEKCLRTLPQSLDKTYERMLCSIESQEEAQQLLSLLCYASRPLSVDEVTEALAVDIDDLECYDPRRRLIGGADDLLRLCPGLIEIDLRNRIYNNSGSKGSNDEGNKNNTSASILDVQTVRIAHFSVQEYLLSERVKQSRAANFALSGPSQHGRISKACLLYLDHDDFLQQNLSSDLLDQYAFARYAAEHWYHHYHQADSQAAQQLSLRVAALITTPCAIDRWIRLHDPDRPCNTGVNYQRVEDRPSPTYYASLLGLEDVLTHIPHTSAADINAQGGCYGNALQAASNNGHEKVVQQLLAVGADVNAQGGQYSNALYAASTHGHEKVVQLLLAAGADVNARGGFWGDALNAASILGYEQVVQLLLAAGADVNVQESWWYGSALQAAPEDDHEKVMQLVMAVGRVLIHKKASRETYCMHCLATRS